MAADNKMSSTQALTILDHLYGKVTDGIPIVSKSVEELASDYLKKASDVPSAVREIIRNSLRPV